MTLEERLRRDLQDPPMPPMLTVPPDLAEEVLRGVHRQRRRTPVLVGAAAVLVAAAIAVPIMGLPAGGGLQPAAPPAPTGEPAPVDPPAPRTLPPLGGGRQAVHAFTLAATGRTSVLDPATGRFTELPYETVLLSPDLRQVAVYDGARIGIVDRAELFRRGTRAVRWTGVPAGSSPYWSPDGRALLSTELAKPAGGPRFTAHRYDLASGRVTSTAVPAGIVLTGTVAWAANSRDYLLLPRTADDPDGLRPGPLRTLHPDGTLGPVGTGPGGLVDDATAYSPARKLVVADTSQIMTDGATPTPVLDTADGSVVARLPAGPRTVGWYDERTVLRLDGSATGGPILLLVDVRTGEVTRQVRLRGVPEMSRVQLGSSAGLPARAPSF